ncbi:MAG: hypothetical protein EOP40_07245 [Rubrivivax sp.]|nr:MAG: hypothetical protein EOP40_07245 [Rubrivivax sp.]
MLTTSYIKVSRLRIDEIMRMHAIFERYYDHGPLDAFLRDLMKKDGAFVVRRSSDDEIVGFSTLAICHFEHEGKRVQGLFSGDTVIEKAYWGTRTLQSAFARKLLLEALKRPLSKQYWLLISKGYKTYLLLTRNFPIFYPDRRREHPGLQAMVANYCEQLYPGKLDHDTMVLAFGEGSNCLKGDVAGITDELRERELDVAFFEARNPHWQRGHELPCIAQADLWTFLKAVVPFMWKALGPRSRTGRGPRQAEAGGSGSAAATDTPSRARSA